MRCKYAGELQRKGEDQTKGELIGELERTRKRITDLEKELSQCKRITKRLKDARKWLRILFEHAPDPYYLSDLKGIFIDGNKMMEQVTGYKKKELIGKNFLKLRLLPPEQIPKAATLLAKNALGQPTGPDKFIFNRKDGSKAILEIRTFPVKVKNKNLVLGIARDITERKKVEEKLRASEEKYRNLVENIPDILVRIDSKGKITYMSKSFESLTKYHRQEVEGKDIKDLLVPESYKKAMERVRKWMKGAKSLPPYEIKVKSRDGRIIPFELNTSPIIENGKLKAIQVIARDVTERKQMREELQKSLEKLQKSLRSTVYALASLVEIRDLYTANHQKRVTKLSLAIAREMGLSEKIINGLELAAALHDIGKMKVPAEILTKPGKLNGKEYAMIKDHPQIGYDILRKIEFPWPVAEIVLQHHERMDGSGYPNGLLGKDIMLEARILAVADVVEAMSSYRPYRAAKDIKMALEEISRNRGLLYDPDVVDACLRVFIEKRFKFE